MIQVIHGLKGSGKTKRIIDMANESIKQQKGDVVFVDDDNRYMFDLRHEVRFVNAGEYNMVGPEMLYGFLCGMLAQNFDRIYLEAGVDAAALRQQLPEKFDADTRLVPIVAVPAETGSYLVK